MPRKCDGSLKRATDGGRNISPCRRGARCAAVATRCRAPVASPAGSGSFLRTLTNVLNIL